MPRERPYTNRLRFTIVMAIDGEATDVGGSRWREDAHAYARQLAERHKQPVALIDNKGGREMIRPQAQQPPESAAVA